MRVYAVGIAAKNDRNGNPRRGWLLYTENGGLRGFHDEGYAGRAGLVNSELLVQGDELIELCNGIPVPPSYYNESLRDED